MNKQDARKIVDNEDYLPWAQVAEAKKVLGIKEQSAAEIWAELTVKRGLEEMLALAIKLNRPVSEIEDLRGQLAAYEAPSIEAIRAKQAAFLKEFA